MLNWKTAGAGLAALGLLAFGHHALAQDDPHASAGAHADAAAHEAMLQQGAAFVAALIADADADAVEAHLLGVLDAHAEEIGGDTEALRAHIAEFAIHFDAAQADPQEAAEHIVQMLWNMHRPQE